MTISNKTTTHIFFAAVLVAFSFFANTAEAASLRLNPDTGVYNAGATFTARVQVVTNGDPVNAAEGTINFNPNELSVVSINRSGSIFNLWVAEPAFSNAAGTVTFSGGVPAGYSGSVGTVLSITFRAKNAGSPRVTFSNGSVLANDGRGTNVLTAMNGGSFTIQAPTTAPEPERIIEYIAPANTPAAPKIVSKTHDNPAAWHATNTALLSWSLPTGVTAVRTLLNGSPSTVPTKVYENPIRTITLTELEEGISYFHIQFKNADGWGKVSSYRLAVDTMAPASFEILSPQDADMSAPEQTLNLVAKDSTSGINRYLVKLDNEEPYEFTDKTASGTLTLPRLDPGYHTVIIEAFDHAGNSLIATHSFTIESFEKPAFTDVPTEMSGDVIPVIKGISRPNSTITIFFKRVGSEPNVYEITANEAGEFAFIPEGVLYSGVYEVSAQSIDQHGAQSEISEIKRIAVQEPGYIRLGSQVVNAMSILVPLLLLTMLLFFGIWYLFFVFQKFRGAVGRESSEALDILHREFASLQTDLQSQEANLRKSRKTNKLTKAEAAMIETFDKALQNSQRAVEKEIQDVTKLAEKD